MTDSIEELATKLEQSLVPFATWDGGRAIQVGLGTYDTKQIELSLRDLRAAALKLRECSEAIRGVLGDDDAATSLADQRARWPERMAALKRAMGE